VYNTLASILHVPYQSKAVCRLFPYLAYKLSKGYIIICKNSEASKALFISFTTPKEGLF
jgi:hypothetical protein